MGQVPSRGRLARRLAAAAAEVAFTHESLGNEPGVILEGKAKIARFMTSKDGGRQMEAFYNPVQRFNRDLSLLAFLAHASNTKAAHPDRKITYFDAFTASGLRALRTRLELPRRFVDEIVACDLSADAYQTAASNLALNGLRSLQ
jgi:tRNA G26 N,N-dimethylase Trm1